MTDFSKPQPVPGNFDELPPSAQVPALTVAAWLGVSRTTIWRWTKAGKLPQPRRLGSNTTRWAVGELRQAVARMADA